MTTLSTPIEKIQIDRYFGGDRGVCVQLTTGPNFIKLSAKEARLLGEWLVKFSVDPMSAVPGANAEFGKNCTLEGPELNT